MKIQHSSHHRWLKEIPENLFDSFGKSSRKRLQSTLGRAENTSVRHEINPLNDDFFKWFQPMYTTGISKKKNAKVFDLRGTTLDHEDKTREYFSLSVFEEDQPIGGTIFRFMEDRLMIAYRIYAHSWAAANLPASPSIYSEYLAMQHAQALGYSRLSHGKDRNPYGLNSNIGLCLFKLNVGCSPALPLEWDMCEIETDALETDALVMMLPEHGEQITKATLIAEDPESDKYLQLFKYPDRLQVTTLVRQ